MTEFQKLYEDNYKSIYYYIWNLCRDPRLAEDMTQEAFYNTLLYICTQKDIKICKSWLIKVAHNVFIDYMRKYGEQSNSIPFEDHQGVMSTYDSAKKIDLISLLNQLPVRYRSLILLREHYGFSYEEIAEIMNCSEATVKVTLYRSRKKMEDLYGKYERDTSG